METFNLDQPSKKNEEELTNQEIEKELIDILKLSPLWETLTEDEKNDLVKQELLFHQKELGQEKTKEDQEEIAA